MWSTAGIFLGTYASLKAARKAPAGPLPRFDADSYQILLRPILQGGAGVVPLL
ncbi:hypothetical protein ACFS3C_14980 [Azotobacter vinelandii]